ncbi:dockerin type I domain-containing protein [Methanolobus sp. WCC5]|jgi:hypothetical protein|uniref:dockerin type I domain-containing protein n=1 Tax=Methanolobus sp. WCC5 TaxID=3125785 RepID=UPI003254FDB9
MGLKYFKETIGTSFVSLLIVSTMFVGIVGAVVHNDTSDVETQHDALASFLLKVGDKDKELLFKYIEDSNLSQNEKADLKKGMLDAWERYPNNTEEDYLVAEKGLDIMVIASEKHEEMERARFLLEVGTKDKELLFKYIVDSNLSEIDKVNLKNKLLDAWERYPYNTENDYLVAKKALAVAVDTSQMQNESEIHNLPNFGPEVFDNLKSNPDIVELRGQVPEFATQEERHNWFNKLDATSKTITEDLYPHIYPNGPIIGWGYNINGYLKVILYENDTVISSEVDEIHHIISKKATEVVGDNIPVVYIKDDFAEEVDDPVGYDERYRPLIGAIKVVTYKKDSSGVFGDFAASLGFAAKKSDGTKGYIIAKHFANSTGMVIKQPINSTGNSIGVVNFVAENTDASFVEYENVLPDIHVGTNNPNLKSVCDYIACEQSPIWLNKTVYKSGRTTGITEGSVTEVMRVSNIYGDFYNLIVADFYCAGGDSGGPVFYCANPESILYPEVRIGGIVCSRIYNDTKSTFAPVQNIYQELGVLPVKWGDYPKGDYNNDGHVNFFDFVELATSYNKVAFDSAFDSVFDFDEDGDVDFYDFVEFAVIYES